MSDIESLNPSAEEDINAIVESFAEKHFGKWETPDSEVIDPEPEIEESEEEEEVEEVAASTPTLTPAPSAPLEIDGVPFERLKKLAAFDKELASDPALVEYLRNYNSSQNQNQAQEPPTPVTLPPDIDLDDPTVAYLYQLQLQNQSLINEYRSRLDEVSRFVQHNTNEIQVRRQMEVEALVRRGSESFKQQHNLTDEELSRVKDVAGKLQVVNVLSTGFDPITGAQVSTDPLTILDRALEIAYWQIPELRNRQISSVIEETVQTKKASDKRKKKLAAISGSSGSAPRSDSSAPKTEAERRQRMIAEVASAMTGEL
jgi:hypothetical protein